MKINFCDPSLNTTRPLRENLELLRLTPTLSVVLNIFGNMTISVFVCENFDPEKSSFEEKFKIKTKSDSDQNFRGLLMRTLLTVMMHII